eukprot:evm.model.scf_1618.2 EVM.evm.TU.scf_1618.2   scf_1618:7747-16451(-)
MSGPTGGASGEGVGTARDRCVRFLEDLLRAELSSQAPDVARVSIALGLVELPLTLKNVEQPTWPINLEEEVSQHVAVFIDFVECTSKKIGASHTAIRTPRDKVTLVANSVWERLTRGFRKDIIHAQHVSCFTSYILNSSRGNRLLDCAGIVTTVLGACNYLANRFGHDDLKDIVMQICEDHCLLNLSPFGDREGSVEVSTDNKHKRGAAVEGDAWSGWLYNGGHPVVCTPQRAIVAALTSMNAAIDNRPVTGTDSEEVQAIQHRLLSVVQDEFRQLMYPNSLCTLADLKEIAWMDDLEGAALANDVMKLETSLHQGDSDIVGLFDEAISLSAQEGSGSGRLWYPYSYLFGYLTRSAAFFRDKAAPLCGSKVEDAVVAKLKRAWKLLGSDAGSAVLRQYKYTGDDKQLHKDIEDVLQVCLDSMKLWRKAGTLHDFGSDHRWLTSVLELWDGICCLYSTRAKPWVDKLMQFARLFNEDTRHTSACVANAKFFSKSMDDHRHLWGPLKPESIQGTFGMAEVVAVGEGHRQRPPTTSGEGDDHRRRKRRRS